MFSVYFDACRINTCLLKLLLNLELYNKETDMKLLVSQLLHEFGPFENREFVYYKNIFNSFTANATNPRKLFV